MYFSAFWVVFGLKNRELLWYNSSCRNSGESKLYLIEYFSLCIFISLILVLN